MNTSRASLLVLLLTTFSGLAVADSVHGDPQHAVGGVGCGGGSSPISPSSATFRSVGFAFSYQANANGGGFFGCPDGNAFINNSGGNWTSLEIRTAIVPGTTLDQYTCAPDDFIAAFNVCNATLAGTQIVFDYFNSTSRSKAPSSGIPNGATFEIDLGESGWTPGQTFFAQASPTPEPGTLVLLFSGLTALVARRRKG